MSGEPYSFPLLVARIPPGGKRFSLAPSDAERAAIASALDIVEVIDLKGDVEVRPVGAEAFAVRGTLNAAVLQTDVVTLDPVRQDMVEEIDLMLQPAEDTSRKRESEPPGPEAPAEHDVYRGGRIDLGVILVEHLALGLDPYPRAPGIEFPGHIEAVPDEKSSPFSVLARLKDKEE